MGSGRGGKAKSGRANNGSARESLTASFSFFFFLFLFFSFLFFFFCEKVFYDAMQSSVSTRIAILRHKFDDAKHRTRCYLTIHC